MAGLPSVSVPSMRVAFGAESDPFAYVGHTVAICRELRRVLRDDGLLWWNVGDSYAGSNGAGGDYAADGLREGQPRYAGTARQSRAGSLKPKDKIAIPERVALALQADGWYYRQDVVWHKRAPMPESVQDRCTKAHEYVYMLAKSPRYFYDALAIAEESATPGDNRAARSDDTAACARIGASGRKEHGNLTGATRNKRSVWTLSPQPFAGAHFATWPPALVEPMILASTSARGACPACGAPWVRVMERGFVGQSNPFGPNQKVQGNRIEGNGKKMAERNASRPYAESWQPSCTCAAGDPIPCVVLDPFNGSGTTGAVAVELGRDYIGVELSAEYAAIARQRIGGAQPALLPVGA